MEIVESIVSDGHGPLNASYICIHETSNPGATAYDHLNYWARDDRYAVHYVADWTQRVYHCVPDNRLCWQVGNGNKHVIGIELCHAETAEDFEAVWRVGVEWAAWMLKKYGWGVDRLLSHDDCRRLWGGTDHTDPLSYFAEYGRSWDEFKTAVSDMLEGDEVTPADYEKIAAYVWGYELDGTSAANRFKDMPHDAALEALGYKNRRMNGDSDVYQLITDIKEQIIELVDVVTLLESKIL